MGLRPKLTRVSLFPALCICPVPALSCPLLPTGTPPTQALNHLPHQKPGRMSRPALKYSKGSKQCYAACHVRSLNLSKACCACCALQETGTCPKQFEPKCFFDWLHWRSELVVNKEQLAGKLMEAFKVLESGEEPPAASSGEGDAAAASA